MLHVARPGAFPQEDRVELVRGGTVAGRAQTHTNARAPRKGHRRRNGHVAWLGSLFLLHTAAGTKTPFSVGVAEVQRTYGGDSFAAPVCVKERTHTLSRIRTHMGGNGVAAPARTRMSSWSYHAKDPGRHICASSLPLRQADTGKCVAGTSVHPASSRGSNRGSAYPRRSSSGPCYFAGFYAPCDVTARRHAGAAEIRDSDSRVRPRARAPCRHPGSQPQFAGACTLVGM